VVVETEAVVRLLDLGVHPGDDAFRHGLKLEPLLLPGRAPLVFRGPASSVEYRRCDWVGLRTVGKEKHK
jgi:hypothetical protein